MILKTTAKYFFIFFALSVSFWSCEREFTPNLPTVANDIVVEGYIEASKNPIQSYVVITKSVPFFKSLENISDLYVANAYVWVIDSAKGDSVQLNEFCFQSLPNNLKKQAAVLFGVNLDSIGTYFNPCIYIDFYNKLKPKNNQTYKLHIRLPDGREFFSSTTIPRLVPVDSVSFIKPPGVNNNDTMAQMRVLIHDPVGKDYYRYLTSINGSAYVASRISVTDDGCFEGQPIKFNLFASVPRGAKTDASTSGLFKRGDTVSIKFSTIDHTTFNFWSTLEYNANSSGSPFASYTIVKNNIDGGVGIWGGYSDVFIDTIVPIK